MSIDGRVVNDLPPRHSEIARSRRRDGLPGLRALPAQVDLRQHGLRLAAAQDTKGRDLAPGDGRGQADAHDHLLDRRPAALSGGQRQRVAIGGAIVRQPKVFVFDEPLSNLDAQLRQEMRTEIKKLHQRLDATIIDVTHDQVEAMTLADRIAVLSAGKLMPYDTPEAIYNRPAALLVAGFTGAPPMNLVDCTLTQGAIDFNGVRFALPADLASRSLELALLTFWRTARELDVVAHR